MKKAPICLCVPCQDMVHAGFWSDSLRMTGFWTSRHPDQELLMVAKSGTILCRNRYLIAKEALATGASHLMWLDTDMRFPPDTIDRFLAHDKDIVIANYVQRGGPLTSTAQTIYDEPMITHPHSTGLEQALQGGFGLALIRREVFEQMDAPWFANPWDTAIEDYVGEDVFWCAQVRRYGFDAWVDHDVSKQVHHMGVVAYHHGHAAQLREAREQQSDAA